MRRAQHGDMRTTSAPGARTRWPSGGAETDNSTLEGEHMTTLMEHAAAVWKGEEPASLFNTAQWRKDGLQQLNEHVWMWTAFGNVYVFPTSDGLVFFDAGEKRTAGDLHDAVRARFDSRLHTAVYSHGHIDHIFGTVPFDEEAQRNNTTRPVVVAHENVGVRFDRYALTHGYNTVINRRQFGSPDFDFPTDFRHPDITYSDTMSLKVGELEVDLHHRRGETDDATIAWLPQQKILACGDFFIWSAPNPGNPQKVQRYAGEWAASLRWMASLGAELLLPGHGLPIEGVDRVHTTLTDTADYLDALHGRTLALINEGRTLDEIIHTVEVPEHLRDVPYLQPSYDEPEFIVRNVWRLFAGWYDGNPATLKPAPRADLGREITTLAGGPVALTDRARALAESGELRLAAQLIQIAVDASPEDTNAHEARVEIFRQMKREATSTMAKGVYAWAHSESEAHLSGEPIETVQQRARANRQKWAL